MESWRDAFESWQAACAAGQGAAADAEFAGTRKDIAEVKARAVGSVINEMMEDGAGPMIVFCAHRAPIEEFYARQGWGVIMGGVSQRERDDVRKKFQAGLLDGVAATIGAAQEALTLSRARSIVFVDLAYNPTSNAQAMARADDVEADEPPAIYILTARGTVDERVLRILGSKTQMIRHALGDKVVTGVGVPPPRRKVGR